MELVAWARERLESTLSTKSLPTPALGSMQPNGSQGLSSFFSQAQVYQRSTNRHFSASKSLDLEAFSLRSDYFFKKCDKCYTLS